MESLWKMATDLVTMGVAFLLYVRLIPLRRDTRFSRAVLATGLALVLAGYCCAAYGWEISHMTAAVAVLSGPCAVLLFSLARYRDSRFVLCICFANTCSMILGVTGWAVGEFTGGGAGVAFASALTAAALLTASGWKPVGGVLELLANAKARWRSMAAAALAIYFALAFTGIYPSPLTLRPEYLPGWLSVAVGACLCYAVFVQSVNKTRKIEQQNQRLLEEQHYITLAYTDALTGLSNRAAWMEQMNLLDREPAEDRRCCIVADCDKFKDINDTYGHQVGDEMLCRMAQALRETFHGDGEWVFRLGGDEFCVLTQGYATEETRLRVDELQMLLRKTQDETGIPLAASAGVACARPGEYMEDVFFRADREMYAAKQNRRSAAGPLTPRLDKEEVFGL